MSGGLHHSVVVEDLQLGTIRPNEQFDKYLDRVKSDVSRLLGPDDEWVELGCPACQSRRRRRAFTKFGFSYYWCEVCNSLYASPRPSAEVLDRFVRHAPSTRALRDLLELTARERRRHISRARARWVVSGLRRLSDSGPRAYLDLAGSDMVFFSELESADVLTDIYAISDGRVTNNPARGEPVLPSGRIEGIDKIGAVAAISVFDLVENRYWPLDLLNTSARILRPGGLLFLTALLGTGFDILVLGPTAVNVYPPAHINLLSVEGLQQCLAATGFEIVEFSTPGQLDMQIVKRVLDNDPRAKLPPFVRYILKMRGQFAIDDFQEYLQRHRLSSYGRVLARRI